VVPWGTNLDLATITRRRGQRISHQVAKNRLRWEQRPDKSHSGTTGKVGHVWLRGGKPDAGPS
jgi:hypothetical protein